jgi:hypothetical protein
MNYIQLRVVAQKISEPLVYAYPWLESDGASFLLALGRMRHAWKNSTLAVEGDS